MIKNTCRLGLYFIYLFIVYCILFIIYSIRGANIEHLSIAAKKNQFFFQLFTIWA